jgi:hypothetical protein
MRERDGPGALAGAAEAKPNNNSNKTSPTTERDKPPQATVLLGLAEHGAELFHAPDGTPYADIRVNGHRETWPVRAKPFRLWLTRRYYETRQGAPSSDALQSALAVLEAMARFDGPEQAVQMRIAGSDGKLYLDIGDATWRAVEIDVTGWRIVNEPPVRFRRAKGMLALPEPHRGGDLLALRRFVNAQHDHDFVLVIAWLAAAFRDRGPYPVLALIGEHGTAKSTLARLLRALIDPHTTALRSLPREDRDLFIAANNSWVIAVDNVSALPDWLSDSFCRLATGGGYATRELYSDSEEALFDATRPIILNGIEDFVVRPDLADRSLALPLAVIPDGQRRTEREFWANFERERSKLLGSLLDAVATGLRELPSVSLPAPPRMADFAEWVVACEPTLPWPAGMFMAAYARSREVMVETTIEADIVATAIRDFMATQESWEGTATDLLAALYGAASEATRRLKSWPATARALSARLRRAAPNLRSIGIGVDFERTPGGKRNRRIHLSKAPPAESTAETPSQPSRPTPSSAKSRESNGDARDANRDGRDGSHVDRPAYRPDSPPQSITPSQPSNSVAFDTVRAAATPCNRDGRDGKDGRDEKIPHRSGAADDAPKSEPTGAVRCRRYVTGPTGFRICGKPALPGSEHCAEHPVRMVGPP